MKPFAGMILVSFLALAAKNGSVATKNTKGTKK